MKVGHTTTAYVFKAKVSRPYVERDVSSVAIGGNSGKLGFGRSSGTSPSQTQSTQPATSTNAAALRALDSNLQGARKAIVTVDQMRSAQIERRREWVQDEEARAEARGERALSEADARGEKPPAETVTQEKKPAAAFTEKKAPAPVAPLGTEPRAKVDATENKGKPAVKLDVLA